ncbi:DUF2235 domain-containing protein [Nocardia sp. NPDC051832]|uniref:DUF2235 domain-containing protein n=1 Tax=Nocardia sp. NPDC051832 TaxID=3155673 RepID=UPI003439B485
MKRLVVCCDGTWKAENSDTVSNIIKIAQTVRPHAPGPDGEPVRQHVIYVSGPGARGFTADRLFGGAFGLGLEANLSAAYWQVAINWEPGDEIFVFGFSRGAYTARSLIGLIDRIGIMTPESMIGGFYPQAFKMYRRRGKSRLLPWRKPPAETDWEKLRADHSYPRFDIDFVGVFDTVGALGVPGLTAWRHRFHNTDLSERVLCARQALAIDERRRNFEPCLWQVPVELERKYRRIKRRGNDRVKQVWFEGVHSDIGGGYAECGLSDITLRWMVGEAEAEGLAFDRERLDNLHEGCAGKAEHLKRHNSLGPAYLVLNALRTLRGAISGLGPRGPIPPRFYWNSWRRLRVNNDHGVLIASTVDETSGYEPYNLRQWQDDLGGAIPAELIEKVPALDATTVTPDACGLSGTYEESDGQPGEHLFQPGPAGEGVTGEPVGPGALR